MKRIDAPNKAENLFGAGKHGWRDGVPGTSTRATEGEAAWFNHVQEEFANIVEGAGEALDPEDNAQLAGLLQLKATPNPQAPAFLKTISDIAQGQVVMMDRFLPSAEIASIRAGTSIYNCGPALNEGLQAMINGGGMRAAPGRYYTTEDVVLGPTTKRIIFESEGGATLFCAHNGHGIDPTASNENNGWHVIRNWIIQGPNVAFPNSALELAGTSVGAGINIHDDTTSNAAAGYNVLIENVEVKGFLYGLRLRAVLLAKIYSFKAFFNQYGVLLDGGQTNACDFFAPSIRQNRAAGVYSSGAIGGDLSNATQNRFWGGIIESNIPYRGDNPVGYSGGWRTARDLLLSDGGHGAVLLNTYDCAFYDTYFENQNVDVWLGNSSDGNSFHGTRHGNGGNGRVGGVKFSGAGVVNNTFNGSKQIGGNATDINVISDHVDHERNKFVFTQGFNFLDAHLVGKPYVFNNTLNQAGGGTARGEIALSSTAVIRDASGGSAVGEIQGIGTATAILRCEGFGCVVFGSGGVGAAGTNTTIIQIDVGLMRNCQLILRNYQVTRSVTIKHDGATGPIVMKAGVDKVLNTYNAQVVFWVNELGHCVEM